MSKLTHQQVRSQIHGGALHPAEREALEQHLASCDICRQYTAMHAYLSEHLPLDIDIPQLSGEQRRALVARIEQQVRREKTMKRFTALARLVAWAAVAVVLVLVAVGIFISQQVPVAEPAADVLTTSTPVATATLEPGLAYYEVDGSLFVLRSGSVAPVEVEQGEEIVVIAEWAWQGEPGPISPFIHLQSSAATVASQGRVLSLPEEGVAHSITSEDHVPIPEKLAPGEYEVWLGLYDVEKDERLRNTVGELAVLLDTIQVTAGSEAHIQQQPVAAATIETGLAQYEVDGPPFVLR